MILGNHIVAPLYLKGGWGDFTNGLENLPLIPLFKGGGQDIPMPEGILLKVLSKEKIDCGQERLTIKVNFDER